VSLFIVKDCIGGECTDFGGKIFRMSSVTRKPYKLATIWTILHEMDRVACHQLQYNFQEQKILSSADLEHKLS
jgi:hypothetical protein